jgi:hypothetical protein
VAPGGLKRIHGGSLLFVVSLRPPLSALCIKGYNTQVFLNIRFIKWKNALSLLRDLMASVELSAFTETAHDWKIMFKSSTIGKYKVLVLLDIVKNLYVPSSLSHCAAIG